MRCPDLTQSQPPVTAGPAVRAAFLLCNDLAVLLLQHLADGNAGEGAECLRLLRFPRLIAEVG